MHLGKGFKNCFLLFSVAVVMFFLMSVSVSAAEKDVVYTSMINSITASTGDGTKSNPYNRFEDAVKNVADGGIIYILSAKSAYINEQTNDMPFIIDKSVTIEPEPGAGRAALQCRSAGIMLAADVTFKNIELGFENSYHDQIYANGYTLELIDVTRNSGCRLIDLAAGSLYTTSGTKVYPLSGKKGQIIVRGSSSEFGNLYAGSINGSFDGDAYISVEDTAAKKIGEVYACGATEAECDRNDWFSGKEPPAPVPDEALYPVFGEAQIKAVDASITKIDGAGATGGTKFSFYTTYPEENLSLYNISSLKVEQGILVPVLLTTPNGTKINLSLTANGTLDLSAAGDIDVNDFTGGGRIILGKSAVMRISGVTSGKTVFETDDYLYTNGYSGPAVENHVYIETNPESKGIFSFIPNPNQKSLQLIRDEQGNWTTTAITGTNIFFTYWTKDTRMGNVSRDWESFDSGNGSPKGAIAIPNKGYHFVEWIDEKGEVVGDTAEYIPTRYYETHCFEARFAENPVEEKPPVEDKPPIEDKPPVEEKPSVEDNKPTDGTGTTGSNSNDSVSNKADESEVNEPVIAKPVTVLKADKITYNTITLTWKKRPKGIKYYIYRSTRKASGYRKIATISKNSYTDKKLITGKKYYYKVKAYLNRDVTGFSKTISVKPVPESPKVTLKSGKKYVAVKYSKVKGADGYEIYRSTKKSKGYRRIATTRKRSYENKGLKSKKKYYYKVRAYHREKGKKVYSDFSMAKLIKVK